jgi:schlafen family protein
MPFLDYKGMKEGNYIDFKESIPNSPNEKRKLEDNLKIARNINAFANLFKKSKIIYGIDTEKDEFGLPGIAANLNHITEEEAISFTQKIKAIARERLFPPVQIIDQYDKDGFLEYEIVPTESICYVLPTKPINEKYEIWKRIGSDKKQLRMEIEINELVNMKNIFKVKKILKYISENLDKQYIFHELSIFIPQINEAIENLFFLSEKDIGNISQRWAMVRGFLTLFSREYSLVGKPRHHHEEAKNNFKKFHLMFNEMIEQ